MTPDAAQGSPAEPGKGSACVIAPYLFALVYRAMQTSERGSLLTHLALKGERDTGRDWTVFWAAAAVVMRWSGFMPR